MRADLTAATVEDVCEWIGSLGLDEYVATFQHHGIDGSQLIQLTDDHLRIELGISKIGHRARIRRERDALVSRSKTGTGSALVARPPPAAPSGSGRIKVSVRVGKAGQWVNIRLTQAELRLAELKARLASALNMDEAAIERLQYRAGADWFAVLRDQDIMDCVADNGGDSLVLQVGDETESNGAENFGNSSQLALVDTAPDGELSVVESKEQVNMLWHGVTWHQRLRALLARGEVQEALDALLEWHGARAAMAQSPAAVYNALLKLVNDTQLPSAVAITAYELMRSRGIKPNAATYDHLLRALIRDGKPEVAARVLVSMDKTGHRPDSSAYNGIMQSLADRGGRGDLTMALQIGAKGLEIEMELTVFTFNKLLAACTRDGATDEGVSTFKLLQKSGQTPDEESYASLLACCCMGSDVSLSMKALQGMINAGYSPKMNLVNRILGACTTSEQAAKVFKVVGDLPDVQLNSRSYAELMRCVRTEGNLELGVRSLKSALRAGVYLDGDVVGSIIDMAVESVDKAEQDRLETLARLQEQVEARKRAELAQEESEEARLNALALAKANKDEAASWREQAAAAEDAAAEAVGSFDKFEAEWQWMETITQDEVETRSSAVFAEKVATDKQAEAEARAEEENRLRIEAEDLREAAERARLVSESNEQDAIAEAASWRETALVAENAMDDMASAPFETPAQEWQWMEASIQDEVSLRAVAEAAREHAEKVQATAEETARAATADKLEAENVSEKDQRARLVAEASEKAAKEETETWRSTAMAAEVAVAEALEQNATTVVDEWGFMEALMTDEAQSHAVVQVEYDTVMEKLGAAAASGSLSAEDAKALAQSELDARLAAEKEATAAKEQLVAAELRWRTAVESAEARATEAEKRMIAAEKKSTESEKRMRTETERLRDHAERSVAEAQRSVEQAEAHKKVLELQAQEEIQARKTAEATAAARAAEVEAARKEAALAEAAGEAKAKQAQEAAAKAAEEEAKRQQAERAEKLAAEAAAAPVPAPAPASAPAPRPKTPEPAAATRAKTPPPAIPKGRAKSPKPAGPPAIPKGGAKAGGAKGPPAIPGKGTAAKGPPAIPGKGAAAKSKPKAGGGLFGGPKAAASEVQYKVVCPGGVLARAAFAMNSAKAGTLKAGEIITALETKDNPNGITRVRFSTDTITGWCSTKAGDGTPLLEQVGGGGSAAPKAKATSVASRAKSPGANRAKSPGAKPAATKSGGTRYKATLNGLCREGFDMMTKKVGTLKKGEVITSLEERKNEKGVTRVRFEHGTLKGWVSTNAGDGSVLLEKVADNSGGAGKKSSGVAGIDDVGDGPPGRMIWYASGDDELEVTVKEFKALVKRRVVKQDTEVWVDGKLDDWLPYGEVGMAKLVAP